MRRQKITMVDPWQITSRGWKAFKTPKAVENFTNKWHVHHVYWRGPGNRRILLVDFNHFKECYQQYRKVATKPTTKKYTKTKFSTKFPTKRTTSSRRPTVGRTTYRTGTRRTTTRRSTWSNRPKTRYSSWKSYRQRSYR